MKKFLKPLVIATSVAAVAGIGAVSFAAWKGGTESRTDSTTNTLGTYAGGFVTSGTVDPAETGKNLVPYDQGQNSTPTVTSSQTVTYTYDLGLVVLSGANTKYQIKVEIEGTAPGLTGKLKMVLTTNGTAQGAPAANAALSSDWKEFNEASGLTFDKVTYSTTSGSETNHPQVTVVLDSSANTDMGKTFQLKFTVTESAS